jgi:hypothetical protein
VRHKWARRNICGDCWLGHEKPRLEAEREEMRQRKLRRAQVTTTSMPGVMGGNGQQPGGTLALITGDLVREEDQAVTIAEAVEEVLPKTKYVRLVDLDDLLRKEIIDAYYADQTISEICRAYKLNPSTLYQMLRDEHVTFRGVRIKHDPSAALPPPPPEEEPEPVAIRSAIQNAVDAAPVPAPGGKTFVITYTTTVKANMDVVADTIGEALVKANKAMEGGQEIVGVTLK